MSFQCVPVHVAYSVSCATSPRCRERLDVLLTGETKQLFEIFFGEENDANLKNIFLWRKSLMTATSSGRSDVLEDVAAQCDLELRTLGIRGMPYQRAVSVSAYVSRSHEHETGPGDASSGDDRFPRVPQADVSTSLDYSIHIPEDLGVTPLHDDAILASSPSPEGKA